MEAQKKRDTKEDEKEGRSRRTSKRPNSMSASTRGKRSRTEEVEAGKSEIEAMGLEGIAQCCDFEHPKQVEVCHFRIYPYFEL
jgi:hypothetical protein